MRLKLSRGMMSGSWISVEFLPITLRTLLADLMFCLICCYLCEVIVTECEKSYQACVPNFRGVFFFLLRYVRYLLGWSFAKIIAIYVWLAHSLLSEWLNWVKVVTLRVLMPGSWILVEFLPFTLRTLLVGLIVC